MLSYHTSVEGIEEKGKEKEKEKEAEKEKEGDEDVDQIILRWEFTIGEMKTIEGEALPVSLHRLSHIREKEIWLLRYMSKQITDLSTIITDAINVKSTSFAFCFMAY